VLIVPIIFPRAAQAMELDKEDHLFVLNFAVALFKHGEFEECLAQLQTFRRLWTALDEVARAQDPDVAARFAELEKLVAAEAQRRQQQQQQQK
jgi:hypothetical protein